MSPAPTLSHTLSHSLSHSLPLSLPPSPNVHLGKFVQVHPNCPWPVLLIPWRRGLCVAPAGIWLSLGEGAKSGIEHRSSLLVRSELRARLFSQLQRLELCVQAAQQQLQGWLSSIPTTPYQTHNGVQRFGRELLGLGELAASRRLHVCVQATQQVVSGGLATGD